MRSERAVQKLSDKRVFCRKDTYNERSERKKKSEELQRRQIRVEEMRVAQVEFAVGDANGARMQMQQNGPVVYLPRSKVIISCSQVI